MGERFQYFVMGHMRPPHEQLAAPGRGLWVGTDGAPKFFAEPGIVNAPHVESDGRKPLFGQGASTAFRKSVTSFWGSLLR